MSGKDVLRNHGAAMRENLAIVGPLIQVRQDRREDRQVGAMELPVLAPGNHMDCSPRRVESPGAGQGDPRERAQEVTDRWMRPLLLPVQRANCEESRIGSKEIRLSAGARG